MKKLAGYLLFFILTIWVTGVMLYRGWIPEKLIGETIIWAIEQDQHVSTSNEIDWVDDTFGMVIDTAIWEDDTLLISGRNSLKYPVEVRIFDAEGGLLAIENVNKSEYWELRLSGEEGISGADKVLAFAGENFVVEKDEVKIEKVGNSK